MRSDISTLFLDHSINKLSQAEASLAVCLSKLTDDQIWQREAAHENTIGNLVLHLCGNMRQWILHGVGGEPDVRVRDAEFSAAGGQSSAELLGLFHATVAEARAVLAALPHERLAERITPQGRDVSVLDAIYQVVGHVQMHLGQIILLTKHYAAQDLDLTIPRPR
ncbi:MAG: DUF1572 family protein [Acidobacteriaceae bacterium]